jgi:transposase-like protein
MRVEKDKRVCPKCKSTNVKTELEMVGEMCPKCKKGSIIEIETGWIS